MSETSNVATPATSPRSPRGPRKLPWILAIVGAFVVGAILGGVLGAAGGAIAGAAAAGAGTPAAEASQIADDTADAPSATPSSAFEYTEDLFTVTLKTKSKQCFGSAGCNVTVVPVLSTLDPSVIPSDASGTMTLEITGDESGTITQTIDLTGSQYNQREIDLSTPRSSTKVKVAVTDVETNS